MRIGHLLPAPMRLVHGVYEETVERGDQYQRQQREDDGIEPEDRRLVGLVEHEPRGFRVYGVLGLAAGGVVGGFAASERRGGFFFVCTVTTLISIIRGVIVILIGQRMVFSVRREKTRDLDDGKLVLRGVVLDLLEKLMVWGGGVTER